MFESCRAHHRINSLQAVGGKITHPDRDVNYSAVMADTATASTANVPANNGCTLEQRKRPRIARGT